MNLFVLTFTALFGVVFSNPECFLEKSIECNTKVFETTTNYEICSLQPKLAECLVEASTGCGLNFPSLEKVQSQLKEICREGSPLSKKLLKHKECLMSKALTDTSCYEGYMDLENPPRKPEEILEVQKTVCKNITPIKNCFLNQSEKVCGSEARRFLETLYIPSMELQKELCDAVILRISANSNKRSEPIRLPVSFGPLEFML